MVLESVFVDGGEGRFMVGLSSGRSMGQKEKAAVEWSVGSHIVGRERGGEQ